MAHKNHRELETELSQASEQVIVGGIYSHFKNPQKLYQVIALGTQEATDKICVIYQARYGKNFIFVRDLDNWLEAVDSGGINIPRFKLVRN